MTERSEKLLSISAVPAALSLLLVLFAGSIEASFHVPYNDFRLSAACPSGQDYSRGGYFRPEYVECVERLDSRTIELMSSLYPILGWQSADSRPFIPKEIPGSSRKNTFRYNTSRRHLEMESLFHFGPVPGNGTLITELVNYDENRFITVNSASGNLSLITLDPPDVACVVSVSSGAAAFEVNPKVGEIYLIERGNKRGMLIVDARDGAPRDTMLVGFEPGAVMISTDTRYLYMTEPEAGRLYCWDLGAPADEKPVSVRLDKSGPCVLVRDDENDNLLVFYSQLGRLDIFRGGSLSEVATGISLNGELRDIHASPEEDRLLVVTGTCDFSTVWEIERDGDSYSSRRLTDISGAVRSVAADNRGKNVYALTLKTLYRLDPDKPGLQNRVEFSHPMQRVAAAGGKALVTGGMYDLFSLPEKFGGNEYPSRMWMEAGPAAMLIKDEKLIVANGLANSLTVIDPARMQEDISILVGVMLGRTYFDGNYVYINNLFRNSLFVYDPDNLRIEDIIPRGGSLTASDPGKGLVMFGDSVVYGIPYPPSRLAAFQEIDIPRGVRFFDGMSESNRYVVCDQDNYLMTVDMGKGFRFGSQPLSGTPLGIVAAGEGSAWVLAPDRLYRFAIGGEGPGRSTTFTARPYKVYENYVASDGFNRNRGGELFYAGSTNLFELSFSRDKFEVMRSDPDTNYVYIGAGDRVYVVEKGAIGQRSIISIQDGLRDIYVPQGSINGYIAGNEKVTVFNRESLFQSDDVEDAGGDIVYVSGDDLYIRGLDEKKHTLTVVDGYRGSIYEQSELPIVPSDAFSDNDRLFLVGSAEGALGVYVNYVDTRRLPRNAQRDAWDFSADNRIGNHR